MREISIWSPINQQDFWLPGVLQKEYFTYEKEIFQQFTSSDSPR